LGGLFWKKQVLIFKRAEIFSFFPKQNSTKKSVRKRKVSKKNEKIFFQKKQVLVKWWSVVGELFAKNKYFS
jgi:hypothetical protein